jgi:hypothetical protein
MLCTLQDTLGLGLTCPDAQGARSTAKWLPEPSECSFLSPQGQWYQRALDRVPGELSRFFTEPPCMETDKGLVYTLLGMRERALRIDGDLEILSPPPGHRSGTLIIVSVPLDNPSTQHENDPHSSGR